MTGRRVYPDHQGRMMLADGDYGVNVAGELEIRPPGCNLGTLTEHAITEHEDGTITVSPSILLVEPGGKRWHGYLERGVWREC